MKYDYTGNEILVFWCRHSLIISFREQFKNKFQVPLYHNQLKVGIKKKHQELF